MLACVALTSDDGDAAAADDDRQIDVWYLTPSQPRKLHQDNVDDDDDYDDDDDDDEEEEEEEVSIDIFSDSLADRF